MMRRFAIFAALIIPILGICSFVLLQGCSSTTEVDAEDGSFVASDGAGDFSSPDFYPPDSNLNGETDPAERDFPTEIDELVRHTRGLPINERGDFYPSLLELGREAIGALDNASRREADAWIRMQLGLAAARLRQIKAEEEGESPIPDENGEVKNSGEDETSDDNSSNNSSSSGSNNNAANEDANYDDPWDFEEESFDSNEVDKFVLSRLKSAREYFQREDRKSATEIVEALLLLVPRSRHRRLMMQLLREIRNADKKKSQIEGRISFTQPFARYSEDLDGNLEEPVEFVIRLTNVSGKILEIDLGSGAADRQGLLQVHLSLNERTAVPDLSALKVLGTTSLRVTGELIRLEPNQQYEFRQQISDLSSLANTVGKQVISEVSIGGILRPVSMSAYESEGGATPILNTSIELEEGLVYVFPPDYPVDQAKAAPLSQLQNDMNDRRWGRLFMVQPFVRDSQLRDVLDVLLDKDLKSAGLQERDARLRLTKELTDVDKGNDVDAWRAWWHSSRYRY